MRLEFRKEDWEEFLANIDFTDHEQKIIPLIRRGWYQMDIAAELDISVSTVKRRITSIYNGTNTAIISCMQQQIAALQSLTKLVVPNTSVCPGWGNVTITPATAATTTPAA